MLARSQPLHLTAVIISSQELDLLGGGLTAVGTDSPLFDDVIEKALRCPQQFGLGRGR